MLQLQQIYFYLKKTKQAWIQNSNIGIEKPIL